MKVASERSFPGSTTSFSVADRYGNVVVGTPTLGSLWGPGVVVGTTGIIFNNGTRHGSTSPYPDDVNYARGGQIPVLNNSPIVVMKDGAFYLALGTPGGETIGQTQFQVLLNVLDYGMEIQEAIEAPRISLIAEPNFYRPGSEVRGGPHPLDRCSSQLRWNPGSCFKRHGADRRPAVAPGVCQPRR